MSKKDSLTLHDSISKVTSSSKMIGINCGSKETSLVITDAINIVLHTKNLQKISLVRVIIRISSSV